MRIQQLCNLTFGGDIDTAGNVTPEELTEGFTPEEIQKVNDFISENEAFILDFEGIPFDGDEKEWDDLNHEGKEILSRMLAKW